MSETELSPPPIPASNASLTLRLQPLLERLPPAEQAGMRRVLAAVVKEEEASSSSGGESGNIKVSDSLRTRAAELHQLLARYDAKEISLEEAKLRIAKIAVDAALEFRHEIYSKLFNSISTEKAKQLVKSSDIVKSSGGQNTSLTYGEIDLFSFACILEKLGSKAGDVFVDLGHGTGKALVCASLFLGDLSRVVGIEIVPELTRVSENVRDELRRVTSACVPEYWTVPPIEVFEGDILTDTCCGFDWTTADIVFVNSTCFDNELFEAVARRAEAMKPGSKFVTFTKQLPSSMFTVLDRRQYAMSWGEATCFVHVKQGAV